MCARKKKKIKVNPKSELSQDFLEEMYDLLIKDETELEGELMKFSKKNPNVEGDWDASFPEYGDESDENAREVADYLTNKPLEMTLEKKLRDVSKALDRIEKGTYGICKYTGSPIGEKRLRARPASSASVDVKKFLTDEA